MCYTLQGTGKVRALPALLLSFAYWNKGGFGSAQNTA